MSMRIRIKPAVYFACLLSFLAIGIIWAGSDADELSPAFRFLISVAFGVLLALVLYLFLRQRELREESADILREVDLARDEFVANISHEIRTPLSGIIGIMHLLRRTALDRNQVRYVDTASNSADMLLNIINDVLAYLRMDTSSFPIESESLDLNEVIEDVTSILAPEALARGLELVSDIDPNIPGRVKGDALRLRQVLNNLLNNAIKYTDSGVISVYVKRDGKHIEVGFSDTGCGITTELQQNLLKRHDRPEAESDRDYEGIGLGLTSSRRLIEAMGSRLQIDSELGKGSRFYFNLDIDEGDSAAFDWKPPQALQQLSIAIISPLELQRRTLRGMLTHWGITEITEFDHDVEIELDVGDLQACDLVIVDQTESEQAVNRLIDRLRNSSDWR